MKPAYANLSLATGVRHAGICTIKIVPREWIVADPVVDFNTGKVLTALQLLNGHTWLTLEFAPTTYEYEEKPKSNKSGSYYEVTLSGIINKYTWDVHQVVETLRYHECVAQITDRYKKTKLVGDKESGLIVTVGNNVKNTQGGQQQVQIQLAMECEGLPPYYE